MLAHVPARACARGRMIHKTSSNLLLSSILLGRHVDDFYGIAHVEGAGGRSFVLKR